MSRWLIRVALRAVFAAFFVWTLPGIAAPSVADAEMGLRLPRFASLRATQVNLRSGPGVRYPIEWVYLQRDLPVEIIQEFDHWRKVRDWEGTEGWMHRSMLSGARSVRVIGPITPLRAAAEPGSSEVARLEGGVIGRLLSCPKGSAFCRIEAGGHAGWLPRAAVWGVYRGETVK